MRSVVRVHLSPLAEEGPKAEEEPPEWGRSSVGRAPALQAGGQELESLRLHWMEAERKQKAEIQRSPYLENRILKENLENI